MIEFHIKIEKVDGKIQVGMTSPPAPASTASEQYHANLIRQCLGLYKEAVKQQCLERGVNFQSIEKNK